MMRQIVVYFKNGYAFVISSCYNYDYNIYTYTCDHCTVSRSSLRRIFSLYPKYDVHIVPHPTELIISFHDRREGTK